jgi:protein involved in polysaccharide export with SLBB domain
MSGFMRAAYLPIAFTCLLLTFVAPHSGAQGVQLTPEQQQMLNQLPPSQRQQAMEALEQLNRQQGQEGEEAQDDQELSRLQEDVEPARPDVTQAPEELEAEGGSRLVINLTPKEDLTSAQNRLLQQDLALQRIQGSHYYELDEAGTLILPGLPSVPLLGLTGEAIQQRLGAEPSLSLFDVDVNLLDTESIGADALEPFGYGVFESIASRFEPITTGPVPPDYVLGPGDSIRVQLFGNVNGIYEFEVTRDGILNLPEIGPITVAGLPFSERHDGSPAYHPGLCAG